MALNLLLLVLHSHFGLRWFYKVLTEHGDKAKILFEHVFGQYQARFNTAETTEVLIAQEVSNAIDIDDMDVFINSIALANSQEQRPVPPAPIAGKTERFYNVHKTFKDKGKADNCLPWWKVCTIYLSFEVGDLRLIE